MENIPAQFHYNGQNYNGIFKRVSGAGNNASYHLMVDNFYYGQISRSEHYGWQFTCNDDAFMKTMAKPFQDFIAEQMKL